MCGWHRPRPATPTSGSRFASNDGESGVVDAILHAQLHSGSRKMLTSPGRSLVSATVITIRLSSPNGRPARPLARTEQRNRTVGSAHTPGRRRASGMPDQTL